MRRGLKQEDLRPCSFCGKGVMHTGIPQFFRVTIERMVANRQAITRQHGLEMMMGGNALLANIMGPNEDMAEVLDSVQNALVCHACAMEPHPLFAAMEQDDVA